MQRQAFVLGVLGCGPRGGDVFTTPVVGRASGVAHGRLLRMIGVLLVCAPLGGCIFAATNAVKALHDHSASTTGSTPKS